MKAAFWRRDNFINDDSEEEGEDGGSVAGSEVLEEGGRAKGGRSMEFGRLDADQMYDTLHDNVRQATTSLLPCSKAKRFSIGGILNKIRTADCERSLAAEKLEKKRAAEERAAAERADAGDGADDPVGGGETGDKKAAAAIPSVCCTHCSRAMDAGDEPIIDATLPAPTGGGCPPLFCSRLCITMHRSVHGRSAVDAAKSAASAGAADGAGEAREQHGPSGAAESAEVEGMGRAVAAAQPEAEDEEELDGLVVLPPALKESEVSSKTQLQRLMNADAGGGASSSRWGMLRRQLVGSATSLKVEEARATGKYYETERSILEVPEGELGLANVALEMSGDEAEEDEDARGDAEEEDGEEADGEGSEDGGEDEGMRQADAGRSGPAGDSVQGGQAASADEAAPSQVPATTAPSTLDEAADEAESLDRMDPNDPLVQQLLAKRQKAADEAAMKRRVHQEMSAIMDVGVRVNAGLAKAWGVAGQPGVDEATVAGLPAAAMDGETQEDDKICSRVDVDSDGVAHDAANDAAVDAAAGSSAPAPSQLIAPANLFKQKFGSLKRGPQQATLGFTSKPRAAESHGVDAADAGAEEEGGVDRMPLPIDESLAAHDAALDQAEAEAKEAEEVAARKAAASLVLDEAMESGEEASRDGEGSEEEGDDEVLGLVEGSEEEEEDDDEGAHLRHAAELAAADDEAELAALSREHGRSKKKKKERAGAKEAKEGGKRSARAVGEGGAASRRKRARRDEDESEADGSEAGSEDAYDSDDLDEFIASDGEAEAEVEAAERVALEAAARRAEAEEEEEEESVATRIIRSRLGDAWVAADRSAPALEDASTGGADSQSTNAADVRAELRKRHKRERELEQAAAAEVVEAEAAAARTSAGSRLFQHAERSLSSFSLLSDSVLAPAPKRQASAPSAAASVSLGGPALPAIFKRQASTASLSGGLGGAAGVGVGGGASVVNSNAPRPIVRVASFLDKQRYSSEMRAQLVSSSSGAAATTASKAFVFSRKAEDERSRPAEERDGVPDGAADRGSVGAPKPTKSVPSIPSRLETLGRTPPAQTHSASAAQSSGGPNRRGASLLATVLNGSKNSVARWGKAKAA